MCKIIEDVGIIKFVVSNLSLFIDPALGLKCFAFLELMIRSEVALVQRALSKLRTLHVVMAYIISMNNATALRSAAAYILQELSDAAAATASSTSTSSTSDQSFIEETNNRDDDDEDDEDQFKRNKSNNRTTSLQNNTSTLK